MRAADAGSLQFAAARRSDVRRPLRRDAELNRQRIVIAAAAVLRSEGLDATAEAVSERARVTAATTYRRFPSKNHLIDEVARVTEARIVRTLHEFGRDPLADRALANGIRLLAHEAVETRACATEYGLRFPERARKGRARMQEEFARLLHRARSDDAVREDVTIDDIRLVTDVLNATASAAPSTTTARADTRRAAAYFIRAFEVA